ncbi:unnamed protein product [Discosporangium mesarthrocarpum]
MAIPTRSSRNGTVNKALGKGKFPVKTNGLAPKTPTRNPTTKGKGKGKAKALRKAEATVSDTPSARSDDDIDGEPSASLMQSDSDNSGDSDFIPKDESEEDEDEDGEDQGSEQSLSKPGKNHRSTGKGPQEPRPRKRSRIAASIGSGARGSAGGSSSNGGSGAGSSSPALSGSGVKEEERAGGGGTGSGSRSNSMVGSQGKDIQRYECELAKTGRAICRRCDEKITKDCVKIGLVVDGSWGPQTQWHHLACTIFRVRTPSEVTGFEHLGDAEQVLVKARIDETQGMADDMYDPISPEDLVRKEWSSRMECPKDVMATLLPYQEEGLAWMTSQEKKGFRGGILADEMGMGKTLQAIATIVANRPDPKDQELQRQWTAMEDEMGRPCGTGVGPGRLNPPQPTSSTTSSSSSSSSSRRGGTLVICPTIAIKQWQSELARFVRPGLLKVVIYHGPKRTSDAQDLLSADIVLTTYAIVENEHRKATAGQRVSCPDCGKRLSKSPSLPWKIKRGEEGSHQVLGSSQSDAAAVLINGVVPLSTVRHRERAENRAARLFLPPATICSPPFQ